LVHISLGDHLFSIWALGYKVHCRFIPCLIQLTDRITCPPRLMIRSAVGNFRCNNNQMKNSHLQSTWIATC
jgi:hypothetical protein